MRRRSFVYRRPESPFWSYDFTVRGRRFRGSTGLARKEDAERFADTLRHEKITGATQKTELSLTRAFARYMLEHGQFLTSMQDITRIEAQLQTGLGKETLLSAIDAGMVASYAARRRATLANRSVNIEIEHLRAVMRRASAVWGVAAAELPWGKLLLEEAGEREHILSAEEEARLFAALRPDYHPMFRFALLSGARRANVVGLTWKQIDWDAGTITWRQKSRKPGGDLHVLPLTPAIAAVLSAERGRHPVYIFTYLCQRNRHDPASGKTQRKGQRYPFTINGWRKEWSRALAEAGIEDFRFHDQRHTAATRNYRTTGDLLAVKEMLGHATIATTMRYAKSGLDHVRAAMEATDLAQSRPRQVKKEG